MSRSDFREQCVERDGGQCLVPWCQEPVTVDPDGPGEVHQIIVRSMYPFYYDQFGKKVGKYVRPNHVQTDEHWSHQDVTRNEVKS